MINCSVHRFVLYVIGRGDGGREPIARPTRPRRRPIHSRIDSSSYSPLPTFYGTHIASGGPFVFLLPLNSQDALGARSLGRATHEETYKSGSASQVRGTSRFRAWEIFALARP